MESREDKRSFQCANMRGADLAGTDLAGADLAGADLAGASMRGANMRGADLADANMRGTDLAGADLAGADLANTDLADANMRGAGLANTDLADANMRGANMRGANLANAQIYSANFLNTKGLVCLRMHDPRGHRAVAIKHEKCWMIKAGCRWMPADSALEHWGPSYNGDPAVGRMYVAAIRELPEIEDSRMNEGFCK